MAHYLCPERLCLDLKFVVFASELEYKAHMAEVHLSHTKMQRSVQKQLARIDPSFMVETTRSNRRDDRGNVAAVTAPQPRSSPAPATVPAPIIAAAPIDPAKLFFGDAVAVLAGRLASASLYEQRNDDFIHTLQQAEKMSPAAIQQLQALCKRYQEGRIRIHEWTQRLWDQLGGERAPRLAPLLIELQLDERKKIEMGRAVQAHNHKLEAFPPLPSNSQRKQADSWHGGGETSTGTKKVVPSTGKTIRLVSSNRMSSDPSKNPLGLGGFGTGINASAKKKEKAVMPQAGFNQAAASGTGIVVASTASVPVPSLVDESQFPALPGTKPKPVVKPAPIASANAFAAVDLDDDGSFVVGAQQQPPSTENSITSGKKKTKRQVVLRFG